MTGIPRRRSCASCQRAGKCMSSRKTRRRAGSGKSSSPPVVPRIAAINPYSFAVTLFVKKDPGVDPEQLIIWRLAAGYLMNHQRQKGMGWWHLSGAALTIWLSRHWTQEEILSAAVAASKYPEQAS